MNTHLVKKKNQTHMRIDYDTNDPNICCIADLHIGVHQNSDMWHDITMKWALWLRDELYNKDIKTIFIAGDIFHYRDEIAVNTLHKAADIFEVWKDFEIFLLVGNHDAYYKDKSDIHSLSVFRGWSNITVIDKLTDLYIGSTKITFCPWGTKSTDIQDTDIVIGHFEIQSFAMTGNHTCTEGMKSWELLDKTDLVITGHFHNRDERKYKNGNITYLGNPFQMDFGDVGLTKGYYILDTNTKKFKLFKNNKSPKHIKLVLSELAEIGHLPKDIKKDIKGNILKFIIDRVISSDEADIILQKFSSFKPLMLIVDYDANFNKFGLDEDVEYDLSGVDIPVAIDEFTGMLDVDDGMKNDVKNYITDLYERHR